ncbi:DNA helicase [Pacificoceanicola onchidii]|uniref:DNA helicase n=1 Tax=Pacificoceanicola onchidii TaxID=2562685 RepID=UPI0010A500A2|nr:DNA helicase [Pacificoceanicola onchidii]
MRLSAPLYRLKREARLLSRRDAIPMHEALDRLARQQGFQRWSHLAAEQARQSPAAKLLSDLSPGELVLIGARPGQGKTSMGLELAARAQTLDRLGCFFTLEYTRRDVDVLLSRIGASQTERTLLVDTSDAICARHILERLESLGRQALVVVDYLQLLDQKRSNPPLDAQLRDLKTYAQRTGTIFAVISQIDRSFELTDRNMPGRDDIRLPNPVNLGVFDRLCFLHEGQIQAERAA